MSESPATLGRWLYAHAPALVAHRGYAARYPENTVLSLAAAVAAGARYLEFDIQLCRDLTPVMCHDPTLLRAAGRDECVLDHDWPALRGVRVGEKNRLGDRFADVPMSSLAQTVTHLNRWPATTSFVEIKRHSLERFGIEKTVAAVLADLSRMRNDFVVISFVREALEAARAQGARQIGWVLREWDDAHRRQLERLAPDYAYCDALDVPAGEALWPGPWQWVFYEITDPQDVHLWRARGAAMIESMAVGELLAQPPYSS